MSRKIMKHGVHQIIRLRHSFLVLDRVDELKDAQRQRAYKLYYHRLADLDNNDITESVKTYVIFLMIKAKMINPFNITGEIIKIREKAGASVIDEKKTMREQFFLTKNHISQYITRIPVEEVIRSLTNYTFLLKTMCENQDLDFIEKFNGIVAEAQKMSEDEIIFGENPAIRI